MTTSENASASVTIPKGETRTVKLGPTSVVIEHDETGKTPPGEVRWMPSGGVLVGTPGTYALDMTIRWASRGEERG